MDKEYKYFDKVDIDYIHLQQNGFTNQEEYNTIIKKKNDKYKDCDLDNISVIPFQNQILGEIYTHMCHILPFKDIIYMYKWKVQDYDHGIGITTNEQIKQFFLEISMILDRDEVYILDSFNTYVNSLLPNNPANISNNVERETNQNQVNIDIEALKEYFKPHFKTQDIDSSNFDTLINDLRGGLPSYTQKDITAIASIIYNGDKLLSAKKPATFNKWLKAFCSMINRNVPKSKPSGVKKQIEQLKKTFYYI